MDEFLTALTETMKPLQVRMQYLRIKYKSLRDKMKHLPIWSLAAKALVIAQLLRKSQQMPKKMQSYDKQAERGGYAENRKGK